MKQKLIRKIERKEAVVGIVGMGYVGLPLMLRFSESGFKVIGIDVDETKIKKLNKAESYIGHIPSERLVGARKSGFIATSDFAKARKADAIIICVPTPLGKHMEPDLKYVVGTIEALAPHLRKEQVVSLESTTYPGTTDEELKPRIEARSLVVGKDIFLVYSPEREDPANAQYDTKTIPKVCGGSTPACLEVGMALYGQVIDTVVPVSSTRAAEMTKLLENIHRAVNIGLVNEMKIIAEKMDIDIYEVIRAASTKPFGFVPYYPGPGLGGHCIPIDPFYLTWKAREYGIHSRFIELAGEINSSMPEYVVSKIIHGLNKRSKALHTARVLILGIAYKKNVDDMRESPSVLIIEMLKRQGARVDYSDPHIPSFPEMREHHLDMNSIMLSPKNIAKYDCVVVATDHDAFDYKMILKNAKFILDTRGVYKAGIAKVEKA